MAGTIATEAGPSPTPPSAVAARTRRLLEGPILSTLVGLAAPNVAVMALQAVITTLDFYFVGWLGAGALAGVSLAFPLMMLMQTMAAGGIGGGVASAVARALGAGRREEANALALHALIIALAMSAIFTTAALWAGPALYRAMGGTGEAVDAAIAYSNVIFGGAMAAWLLHTLASIVRGTGQMLLPATVIAMAGAVQLILSPSLLVGLGPFPRLGVAGAALAYVASSSLGTLVLFGYLLSGRSLITLAFRGARLRRGFFGEILRVGAPGALNTILTNMTIAFLTALVGPFGTFALAGYGIGARLEYLQIPLVFGFGSALVTMVGTNIGAGHQARAERVAWTGAGLAGALTGSVGLFVALFPHLWLDLFTSEPDVLAVGQTYLQMVGPAYGFFGIGLALYFASQGAGRLMWPLLAGFIRLLIAGGGGWLVIHWLGGGLAGLFGAVGAALVVFGVTVGAAIGAGAWRPRAFRLR